MCSEEGRNTDLKKFALVLSVILMMTIISPITAHATEQISEDELNSYIQTEFEKTHVPAMSVAIVDTDNVEFIGNYGDCESADTPFILGSISKSFTAVAIMQLVEQGKINLDEPMSAYLPEADQSSKTTVKQLLHHTSGIHTYMTLENYSSSDTVTGYEYANVNYNLLGLIVEQASGASYADYLKANIFTPLGMTSSYTSLYEAKTDGLIDGNRNCFGIMYPDEYIYPTKMTSGWMTAASAYIISTANDMGKYLQFYLNGGNDVLSSQSMELMYNDTVSVQENYEYGYGLGIDKTSGVTILTHGGNVENYTTYMFLLPESDKAAIVLTNACDFFVSNDMVIQTAYNIAYKLLAMPTSDIGDSTYMTTHLVINAILLFIAITAILPLFFLKKWRSINKGNIRISSILCTTFIHIFVPTLLLLVPKVFSATMWVAARFAPDVFWVLIISSLLLYLAGIYKIVFYIRTNISKRQNQ